MIMNVLFVTRFLLITTFTTSTRITAIMTLLICYHCARIVTEWYIN
jgi:hypothetical protein